MTEMRLYDLRVTVERIEGRSVCGLEVGDFFEVTESSRVRIPDGRHFCLFAIQAVLPLLPAKMRRLPDEDWLEQDTLVCCPDPEERLVMRIERIGERTLVTEETDRDDSARARPRAADGPAARGVRGIARAAEAAGRRRALRLPRPPLPAGDRAARC